MKKRVIPQPVIDMMEMMGNPEPYNYNAWTVECGLHSGFKPCCIIFYVQVWCPSTQDLIDFPLLSVGEDPDEIVTAEHIIFTNYREMLHKWSQANKTHINYIPCPACFLARDFVTVKECDCYRKRRYPLIHEV